VGHAAQDEGPALGAQDFAATSSRVNLDAAKARGQLPAEMDTEGLARFLVALNIGLITYGVVAPDGTDRGPALAFLDSLLGRPGSTDVSARQERR
jgi:hypothetical protein